MPCTKYPFTTPQIQQQKKPLHLGPWLPVLVHNPALDESHPRRHAHTWGLLDTGATGIVIPTWMADYVEHNIPLGKPTSAYGLGGNVEGFLHTCGVDVFGMNSDAYVLGGFVIHVEPQELVIMDEPPFILLGPGGFSEEYVVTVDYATKTFCIKHPPACCNLTPPPCTDNNT